MTREEREDAIDIIQSILDRYEEDECLVTEITIGDEDIKAFKMAIKALEQEPMLDKLRAEIESYKLSEDELSDMDEDSVKWGMKIVYDIIDKYKADIEPQESEDT